MARLPYVDPGKGVRAGSGRTLATTECRISLYAGVKSPPCTATIAA
jgi:hypothetical protein